jgi:hypothetical protein
MPCFWILDFCGLPDCCLLNLILIFTKMQPALDPKNLSHTDGELAGGRIDPG